MNGAILVMVIENAYRVIGHSKYNYARVIENEMVRETSGFLQLAGLSGLFALKLRYTRREQHASVRYA